MTRDFDLSDILSITDGALVSSRHIGGVYDILGFMTGDALFTHQLGRASEACRPVLLEQHPQLADAAHPPEWAEWTSDTSDDDRKTAVETWVADMKARHGDTLPVAPLTSWEHRNPIDDMVGADRVIVVDTERFDADPDGVAAEITGIIG